VGVEKKVKKKRENEETLEHHLFPPSLLCSAPRSVLPLDIIDEIESIRDRSER